jgi:Lon protease-like protein
MSNDASGKDGTPRILPVFPLPNTVFFPCTSLPLHIFEPRYRAMVRDVKSGEGLIVISLMAGNDFCDLGTVGRVRDLEPLEDGRFDLRLEGLERVSLAEVPCDTPYRQVRVESRPERTATDDSPPIAEARLELLAAYGFLRSVVRGDERFVLHQDLPFEVVVNTVCAGLPIDASLRQQLLAEDSLIDRHRLGLDYLSKVIEAISRLGATKDNGGSLMN